MATRFITSEMCKVWEKNGKNEFIKLCRAALQGTNGTLSSGHYKDLKCILYELCWHAILGNLRVELVISAITEILVLNVEISSLMADLLLLLDAETQCSDNRDQREKFLWLLNGCTKKVVPEHIIKERLDFETTGDAGIVKNRKGTQTKFIKIKTRLFYKQQKFNLFREESEGYAKLMTELNQEITGNINSTYMLEVIKSLIGCFNLDPNRVLDVILESFECRTDLEEFYIPLLQSFLCNSTTISQVLGFKFAFYQNDVSLETPPSLYAVAALLLQHGLIRLEQLYNLLTPSDNQIVEYHKQEVQDARIYARKMNMINTSSSEKQEDNPTENDDVKFITEDNQKLGLCAALLEVGDWQNAHHLMAQLPDYYVVSHSHIVKRLCELIYAVIDPLYQKHSGLPEALKQKAKSYSGKFKKLNRSTTFADLRETAIPMILALGPYLYMDPVLMVKIIRLAKAYLQEISSKVDSSGARVNNANGLEYDFLTILDEALLPSLSLLEGNCCMAEELWSVLKLFPYQNRFRLYSQWKSDSHLTQPLLIRGKADTLKKIKYIMKRLSKENVKPSGRQIGKLSHSSPGYLFDYVLSQIQAWDNLIGPVVDSLKYLTSLSYDVLAYCVIEALANPEKERMKHDGTSISLWLQSLSNFSGAVFKKYPIELTGLLQYVANQLKAEKSLDLLVLKEIVQKMAGIEATDEMTNEQLDAMAGGELLRAEGGYFNQVRNTKKSSQRLKEALTEQDLALPLCFLMAQQRNCILFHEQEQSHLKLVGKLYDQCQDTLVQFGSFLSSSLSMEDYVKRLPKVHELLSDYHIQADVAFFLARPMFNYAINSKFEELRKQDRSQKMTSSQKLQKYVEAVEAVMDPVVDSLRPLQSPKIWEDLSPRFYVTFWSLAMYDLHVPTGSYEREIARLKQQISQADDNKDMVQSKKKKEKERCLALIEKLSEEEKRQQEHCTRVLARLRNEKDNWFQSRSAKNETITQFLQLCVFPRCIFTAIDALYCARFVHLIHTLKTPNFSTLICYDRIFCDITYTVNACTENEANHYGRFLCAMLETVMRWHSDKGMFEKECSNFPGFMTKFRGANQAADSATDHVDYENYRHVCHKWHFKITKALVICLESGDYVQIRNSLIVLTKILPHFPVITNLSQALERRIEKIRQEEKDKRPDLYALATGYAGQLKSKKPSLIPEHEFHLKETKEQVKSQMVSPIGSKESSSKSSTVSSSRNEDYSAGDAKSESSVRDSKQEKSDSSKSSGKGSGSSSSKNNAVYTQSSSTSKKDAPSSKSGTTVLDKENDKLRSHVSTSATKDGDTVKEDRYSSSDAPDKGSLPVKDEKKEKRENSSHHGDKTDKTPLVIYIDGEDGNSKKDSDSHAHRRALEGLENERVHKRRRTDGVASKNPKTEDKSDMYDRDSFGGDRLRDKSDSGERSSSRERRSHGRDSDLEKDKQKMKEKEKKTLRKREQSEELPQDVKRRRNEEDIAKQLKRNGGDESKDRYRRDETSPKNHGGRDKRIDKDEKKHRRSPSGSGSSSSSLKKRS